MKKIGILVFIGVIIAGVSLAIFITNKKNVPKQLEKGLLDSQQTKLETKTDSQDSITVEVTPKEVSKSLEEWQFEIALDTHSGNLDQDLAKIAILKGGGIEMKPIGWEGDPPQGHHRRGLLKFNSISPLPNSIELKIDGMGTVERVFRWQLR